MNKNLLKEFLSEEADAYTRRRLLDSIREQRSTGTPIMQEYALNRFNVIFHFDTKQVSLKDDLTVGPHGEYSLSVDEFEKALQEHK